MKKNFYMWKNMRDNVNTLYPMTNPIPDEVIDDITDRIDRLSDTGARLALIAILENLTNDQLNNVVYWALGLMGDRIDGQTMKCTDAHMDRWMGRISPTIRQILYDAVAKANVLPCEDSHDE